MERFSNKYDLHYITSHHITPNTTGVCIQSFSWTFIAMRLSLFILILSCLNGIFGSGVYSQRPYFHWIKSKLNCPKLLRERKQTLLQIWSWVIWGKTTRDRRRHQGERWRQGVGRSQETSSEDNSQEDSAHLSPPSSAKGVLKLRPDREVIETKTISDWFYFLFRQSW